jgi:hypothetical protein
MRIRLFGHRPSAVPSFFETDGGVDARAQRGTPFLQVTIEQQLHRLTEQGLPEFDIALAPKAAF